MPMVALASPPATSARDQALKQAKEGYELFERNHFEEAYERFRAADRLFHAPTVVIFEARCQQRLGKLTEAEALYVQLLDEPLPKDAPAQFVEAHRNAERELADLRAQRKQQAPAPPLGPPAVSEVRPPAPSRGSEWPGYVTLGAGGLSLGIGAVTGLLAVARTNDLKARCPDNQCSPADQSTANDIKSTGNVSTVAFLAGGALVATGVLLVLLPPGGAAPAATPVASAATGPTGQARRAGTSHGASWAFRLVVRF
jgi:hypothetical protein